MSTSGRVGRWLREFTGRDGPLPDPLVRAAKQAPDRPLVGTRPLEADGMPIPGVGPQRTQLRAALVTIRPLQWIKNVLVIAAGLAVFVLIVSPGGRCRCDGRDRAGQSKFPGPHPGLISSSPARCA